MGPTLNEKAVKIAIFDDEGEGSGSDVEGEAMCRICLETKGYSHFSQIQACAHLFCTQCLQSFLEIRINESESLSEIQCPDPECDQKLRACDVEYLLAQRQDLLEKYSRFLLRKALLTSPDARWCPQEDCNYALLAGPRANQCPKLLCRACDTEFCFICRGPWHPGETCTYPELNLGKGVKACPACQAPIHKQGGCNEIRCRICGVHFCWICGQSNISGFHFFGRGGCPQDGERRQSILWRLFILGVLWIFCLPGIPVLATLVALAAIPIIPIFFAGLFYRQELPRRGQRFLGWKVAGVSFCLMIFSIPAAVLIWILILAVGTIYVYCLKPLTLIVHMEFLENLGERIQENLENLEE